jgi:hypothetical protein
VSCRFSPFSFQKWTNKKLVLKTKLIQKKDKEISTFPTPPNFIFNPTTHIIDYRKNIFFSLSISSVDIIQPVGNRHHTFNHPQKKITKNITKKKNLEKI